MIQMSEQKDLSPEKNISGSGFNINPMDMVMYLLNRWYWFVLSVALFGGYAWYQYAKTPFKYSRSATVMIKNANQGRNYGLERFQTFSTTNVSNEILQFQSHNLMREVVSRLNANISYTISDGLREKELYTQAPIRVSFVESEDYQTLSVDATPVNDHEVRLTAFGGDMIPDASKTLTAKLNDTIPTPIGRLVVSPTLYYSNKWFGTTVSVKKNSIDNMASLFGSNLNISQAENDASILYLSINDYSTVRAEDVLNMLITVYNEETIKDKNQIAINTSQFINERLIIIEKELGGVESEIENYKRQHEIIDVSSSASTSVSDKQQYGTQATEMELQIEMANYIKQFLVDPSKITGLIPSNTGIADANIEAQIVQYNANKLKRDKLVKNSSNKNPVVQELNNTLLAIRQNIIRDIDNLIVGINAKLKEARNRTSEAQRRIASIPTQQRQMLSIERQQRIKEELYLYLLNKREENALSQATTETDVRVLDPAGGSDMPYTPNGKNIIMGGVMKGIALPAVILLAFMFFDTKVHTRKDIEDNLSVPFLGEIPLSKSKKEPSAKGKKGIIVRSQGRDIASEAFRIVRTNMEFMRVKSKDLQVVTFSSFGPGAGKTFVCSNLAASMAQTEKKVILIDLDIRKGTLSSHIHHHDKGMTSYLSGSAELSEIIKHDELVENLDIIPAGPAAPNPAELLLSERLETMIETLRKQYDYIIVDNVPVGIIADAAITNRIADLTISLSVPTASTAVCCPIWKRFTAPASSRTCPLS